MPLKFTSLYGERSRTIGCARDKGLTTLLAVGLLGASFGCQQPPPPPPDTRAQDEAAIRSAVAEWSKAAQAKDVDKFVSFYSADASLLAQGAPIATGKEEIRKAIEGFFALPGLNLSFAPTKVEVARSGDLAYEMGTYEMTVNDPKGKPVTTKGKYVVAWKKQADGSWKAAADIFNADQ